MDSHRRAVILTELMDRLRANGSWCGHTHMQMATYFLQDFLAFQPDSISTCTCTARIRTT